MFTLYDKQTGHIGAQLEGQGDGEEHITDKVGVLPGRVPNTKYVDPSTGRPLLRTPVYLRFSRSEGLDGSKVSLLGAPEGAFVVHRGQLTDAREFTVDGRDLRVCLIGKFSGEAVCSRLTEDALVERELRVMALERIRSRNK